MGPRTSVGGMSTRRFSRTNQFGHTTVRKIHTGPQPIKVQVNGRISDTTTVEIAEDDVSV